MDCYRLFMEDIAHRIQLGENMHKFSKIELVKLQEYLLDIRDLELYDKIAEYLNKS